jgi:ABC-type cobalamin/Fe3+-siderophores transport system ATPase subunit
MQHTRNICCHYALELITNPSVLILDEPTSGLDSTIALRLADTLASLARDKGRTVRRTCWTTMNRLEVFVESKCASP